jgi:hypothetical protein
MKMPESRALAPGRWTSLWCVALVSLVAQMGLCQFFSFGALVPTSLDVDPSNLWKFAYHFPPAGTFQVLNWLGVPYLPQPLNPLSVAAATWPVWLFFTAYVPVVATLALLAMAAVLRELDLSRPAALFGAVVYAWQGDILSFIYPGHYGHMTSWFFFAVATWSALRAGRSGLWPYAVMAGAACGLMVGLLTNADRGGIACLLVAAVLLAPLLNGADKRRTLLHFALCVGVAALVALAPLLALYQSNIADVTLAGTTNRAELYKLVTQYSLGPAETLTYLVPGFFGWHIHSPEGLYWGWIGEWPDWPKNHHGSVNLNLAISTTGTLATALALLGILAVLGIGSQGRHTRFYGRMLLVLGAAALVLSWGWHTGSLYRLVFTLPLMDKWRNPLKWLEIANFVFVVLAAMGFDQVLATLQGDSAVARRQIAWVGALMLTTLGLLLALSYPLAVVLAPRFQNEGFEPSMIANMMATMHSSVQLSLAIIVLAGLVVFGLWRAEVLRRATLINPLLHRVWQLALEPAHLGTTLAILFAALSALQLGAVARHFIDPTPLAFLTDSNPLLDSLRARGNRTRVSVSVGDPVLQSLLQNQMTAMDIACLDISAASRIPQRLQTFFDTLADTRARLWLLTGVRAVVVSEPEVAQMQQTTDVASSIDHADGYTIAPTPSANLPSHAIVELKDTLAKATFVTGAESMPSAKLLQRLKDPQWDPRASVLFASDDPAAGHAPAAPISGDASGDVVQLHTYTTRDISLDVDAQSAGYVLINDEWDADWHADLNGHAAPILRADYLLRAVAVPAGHSHLALHYVSTYHLGALHAPTVVVNSFCDVAMIAAWLVPAFFLRRTKMGVP